MTFEEVKSPEQLMLYLDHTLEYGVIDDCGNKYYDSNSDEFQNACNHDWKLRSVECILQDGVGHCYDQVEVEREWFTKNGYQIKTFWISAYQEEIENSGFSHTYLIYKDDNAWKLFGHSDFFNRGIYKFDSVQDAVRWQADNQIKLAAKYVKPRTKYVVCIKEYSKPPINVNMEEYLHFMENSKDYDI